MRLVYGLLVALPNNVMWFWYKLKTRHIQILNVQQQQNLATRSGNRVQ